MSCFNIKIAGLVARITSKYRPSDHLFAEFRTDEHADFEIPLTDEDIILQERSNEGKVYIEASRALKIFSDALLDYDVLLLHGAAVALNNSCYVFTAPSGTGKTTHINKWLENNHSAYVINGDKPFLRFCEDGAVLACGSPWAGKENMYCNTTVPLKSIILLERAEDNQIEPISFSQAFPFLLKQVYRPDDVMKMRKTLQLMQRLASSVTFFRFYCNNFKDDCFDMAYRALVGEQK